MGFLLRQQTLVRRVSQILAGVGLDLSSCFLPQLMGFFLGITNVRLLLLLDSFGSNVAKEFWEQKYGKLT